MKKTKFQPKKATVGKTKLQPNKAKVGRKITKNSVSKYILERTINIEPLLGMKKLLQKILNETESEIEQMAAVQAFEVSYELAWHTCQKVLKYKGEDARFPRDVFRLSAEMGLIKDPEIWFDFMDKRNDTSHSYNINILEEVFIFFPRFIKEFNDLIKNLQKLK